MSKEATLERMAQILHNEIAKVGVTRRAQGDQWTRALKWTRCNTARRLRLCHDGRRLGA